MKHDDPIPPLATLVPHQGAMCLLERVLEWSEGHIVLAATSHRSAQNPLRADGRLRCVHLCEYAAQAMAVHGALLARNGERGARPGMLVSLRNVKFSRDYVEDLPDALRIEARRLLSSESSLQYSFLVTHRGETLAEGRAAVVLAAAE